MLGGLNQLGSTQIRLLRPSSIHHTSMNIVFDIIKICINDYSANTYMLASPALPTRFAITSSFQTFKLVDELGFSITFKLRLTLIKLLSKNNIGS